MEKFQAALVLGGVGDALGYRKGCWEISSSAVEIQKELVSLGGLGALRLDGEKWPLSDRTLMHMKTAEALVTGKDGTLCMPAGDVKGRDAGQHSRIYHCYK